MSPVLSPLKEKIIYINVGCHYVNQVGQLDRQQRWWQACVRVTGSLSAALVWIVPIRDIHSKGQSGRISDQSCLRRPLFLIITSEVLLSTSLPLSPTGISESSMMCPSRQAPSASWRALISGSAANVQEHTKQKLLNNIESSLKYVYEICLLFNCCLEPEKGRKGFRNYDLEVNEPGMTALHCTDSILLFTYVHPTIHPSILFCLPLSGLRGGGWSLSLLP